MFICVYPIEQTEQAAGCYKLSGILSFGRRYVVDSIDVVEILREDKKYCVNFMSVLDYHAEHIF